MPGDFSDGSGRNIASKDKGRQVGAEYLAQTRHDVNARQSSRQIVIDDDHVRSNDFIESKRYRFFAIGNRRHAMAILIHENFDGITYDGIVFDDKNDPGSGSEFFAPPLDALRYETRRRGDEWNFDRKNRTATWA